MLNEQETLQNIRLAKTGDGSAKETLIEHNTSLLKSIVRRYLGKGVDYDDLFELACMGFLKAIAGFDERFGVRFSTYAVPMIAGEIKRFLRDDGSIKVSRALKKSAREINRYIEEFMREHAVQPTIREIADTFSMEEGDVVLALGSSCLPVSLYEQSDCRDEKGVPLADRIPAKDTQEELLEHLMLKTAIGELPEREQKIVYLRFFRDMTQSEVARCIGVSQVQVSRLESKIMEKFKEKLL